jgi:hypothetical protein
MEQKHDIIACDKKNKKNLSCKIHEESDVPKAKPKL